MPTAAGQTMVNLSQLPHAVPAPTELAGPAWPQRACSSCRNRRVSSPSPRRRGRRPFFPKLQRRRSIRDRSRQLRSRAGNGCNRAHPAHDGPADGAERGAQRRGNGRRLADAGSRGAPAGGRRGRPQPDRRLSAHGDPDLRAPGPAGDGAARPRLPRPRLRPP